MLNFEAVAQTGSILVISIHFDTRCKFAFHTLSRDFFKVKYAIHYNVIIFSCVVATGSRMHKRQNSTRLKMYIYHVSF